MLVITNPALNTNLGTSPGLFGGATALQSILTTIISLGLVVGGVLFMFMLLWGGLEYVLSGGDKEATQKATKRLSSAVIGLVIVLCSFAIIKLIEIVFGISILNFSIPTLS